MAIKTSAFAAMLTVALCASAGSAFAACGGASGGSAGIHAPSSGAGSVYTGSSAPHVYGAPSGSSCATGSVSNFHVSNLIKPSSGGTAVHTSPGTNHASLVHTNAVNRGVKKTH